MYSDTNGNSTIIRTGRGLTIAGTRITLYQLMDYFKAKHSPEKVRELFQLTLKQMADVMAYLNENQQAAEMEYQQVLKQAEENRLYWEDWNRDRFAAIYTRKPKSADAELWQKLQEWKKELATAEPQY